MPAVVHTPVHILNIATAVPETAYKQDFVVNIMRAGFEEGSRNHKLLGRMYAASGIDTRHSVIRDYADGLNGGPFFDGETGRMKSPSTGERNDLYAEETRALNAEVACRVIGDCEGIDASDITHVITVSCTGFYAPGPEFHLVRDLELNPAVGRFHVGFMGCFAAFPALKMAQAFCQADPGAVVLVVCVELCTLHLQPPQTLDDMMAASVFADGASAAVVSARTPKGPALRIDTFASDVAPDSEQDMAWRIGNSGFDMVLSRYVPKILESNIRGIVDGLLERAHRTSDEVDRWAVHPGGRAILDGVQKALDLDEGALDASRTVLRAFGNMSSATILFVLKELLSREAASEDETVYAMAFGPGLTVESVLMTRV